MKKRVPPAIPPLFLPALAPGGEAPHHSPFYPLRVLWKHSNGDRGWDNNLAYYYLALIFAYLVFLLLISSFLIPSDLISSYSSIYSSSSFSLISFSLVYLISFLILMFWVLVELFNFFGAVKKAWP